MPNISRRHVIATALPAIAALPLLAISARRARAATHQVEIKGFAFSPASLNVAVGDSVVFTNRDSAPHTATALDGSFDTGTIRRNKAVQVTISAAGTHGYRCKFHAAMKATLTAG